MFKHLGVNIDDKKKGIIITASIVFLTLLICFNIIKSHSRKKDSIRQDMQDQIRRIALRTDIEKIENIHQEYAKYFYDNIDQQTLRAIISSLATESGVNIVSIRTLDREQVGSLSKESSDISLRCNYNQLGIFISKIENLINTTKIESLSMKDSLDFKSHATLREKEQQEIMESDIDLSVSMVVSGYSTKA
jgi:Tfp pilus assembly protein PilO